ncbi:MAG: DNA polymerase IV [bacterium]|jgi:DNA polymerase-4
MGAFTEFDRRRMTGFSPAKSRVKSGFDFDPDGNGRGTESSLVQRPSQAADSIAPADAAAWEGRATDCNSDESLRRDPAWLNRPGRMVFLCDMDTFFVSVERLFDPSLIGRSVIVGGPKGARGVVAACSYEARVFGVRSGMSLRTAAKLCPHGEFVYGRGHDYSKYSDRVMHILESHLPEVRAASIDEFYCEVTGMERVHPDLWELGRMLKREVFVKTGLPMTIGGGRNRLVAKIASKEGKPDGLYIVPPGTEAEWLSPMTVDRIPGIGPKTTEALRAMGIRFIGELAACPKEKLVARFGKWGGYISEKARGREVSIYQERSLPKSIGNESTFRADVDDIAKVKEVMRSLLERACFRLRREKLKCREISVKLRYFDFDTHTSQMSIPRTCVDEVIWPFAEALLAKLHTRRAAVRLVGVRLSSLSFDGGQLELFSAGDGSHFFDADSRFERMKPGRLARPVMFRDAAAPGLPDAMPFDGVLSLDEAEVLHEAVDEIRDRYGYDSIGTGPSLKRLIAKKKRRAGIGEAGGLEVARPRKMK